MVVDITLRVGVRFRQRVEGIDRIDHSSGQIGVVLLEVDPVAFDGAPVAFEPFPDVAHSAVAGEVGARHQCRTSVLFHQVYI